MLKSTFLATKTKFFVDQSGFLLLKQEVGNLVDFEGVCSFACTLGRIDFLQNFVKNCRVIYKDFEFFKFFILKNS